MKLPIAIGVALAAVVALPMAVEAGSNPKTLQHRYLHRHSHIAVQPPSMAPVPTLFPAIAPYPDGRRDEDGLSRHINDCNKGCIGGNPG